ncbi:MAG: hypothetical protein V7603_420 [Micromonosporaceae bacterium]
MTSGHGDQGNGGQQPADPRQPARGTGRAAVPSQGGRTYTTRRYRDQAHRGSPKYHTNQHTGSRYPGPSRGSPSDRGPRSGLGRPERPDRTLSPETARTRRLLTVLGCLAVAALLGVLATAGYLTFSGTGAGAGAGTGTGAGTATGTGGQGGTGRDLASQSRDPAPLTVSEVFPGATVTASGRVYPLLKSQGSADCRVAVVGDLAGLLSAAGCTQVVRGTLTSPDKVYVLTAGIANLREEAAARQVADGIQASVSATRGRLTGYPAGGTSDVIARSPTRLGWDVRGHFLLYCVVARADGARIADQATVQPLIDDLIERYLKGTVLQARSGK